MPDSRRVAISIESPKYGNVLWLPEDNGRTRIGFVWPDEKTATAETVMEAAKNAVHPFELEFVKLDWWTLYAIGQRVAESFRDGPVLLAGDAGHTHSSGAAQGMNTGIHDATNLGWKLTGTLKGWYTDVVLDTYAEERRKTAQQLIQIDRDMAACISGVIPAHFNAPPDADVNDYFYKVLKTNTGFTIGLGISYEENILNRRNTLAPQLNISVGHRAPDMPVFLPGARYPRRLQEFMPNHAKFWILVFAGGLDPDSKEPKLRKESIVRFSALRTHTEEADSFVHTLVPAFEFLTIIKGDKIYQSAESLDGEPLGRVLHDRDGSLYAKYGIDDRDGAIVVLRPDGIVGFFAGLDQYEVVREYFAGFVRPFDKNVSEKPESNSDFEKQAQGMSFGEIFVEEEGN